MTFDPFGDFETRGYLRNVAKAKDSVVVQRLQHNSFLTGIDAALAHLEGRPTLSYGDVLNTHKTLFEGVFPWAGEDRLTHAPHLFITKGAVLFAHPNDIRKAVDYALQKGQDKAFIRQKPGEVMGYLAYGDPFLDGNGRTIMLVHAGLRGAQVLALIGAPRGKMTISTRSRRSWKTPAKARSINT